MKYAHVRTSVVAPLNIHCLRAPTCYPESEHYEADLLLRGGNYKDPLRIEA